MENLRLRNYMEEAVKNVLIDMIQRNTYPGCTCDRCLLDIQAYVLNMLPSKYVVTTKGEVFAKIAQMKTQFETDIVRTIINSIDVINSNPRH